MRARDPIAIVGVGCRFPGGADDTASFWELLRTGTDAITEVPADRWNASRFHHPDAAAPGRMVTRWGGFVSNVDRFDAAFFGIAPREAARMDPQQRWLAEVAWEAMEDAGVSPDALAGTRTGVFVGISHSDYPSLIRGRHSLDSYVNSGSALSIAANRLSFLFDLRGPSLAVDTACSSSLVALHLAAKSLRSGESEYALVGGANALLTPEASIGFSQARMLSPRGRCRTFDADADGYVRAEGAAAVLLMPLAKANELGLQARALLIATASNQDGRSSSLTVPSQRAQEEMILEALRDGEVDPRDVVYVEAHGTGTIVGDRVEIRALAATIGNDRPPGQSLLIGSVKTNIGHLEPASGLAGLLKAVLVLEHREVPPNLHFERPNPKLPLASMTVPTTVTPLPAGRNGGPLVGVNSFGFGGTNAHALLAPAPDRDQAASSAPNIAHVLPLSARTTEALSACVDAAVAMIERGEPASLEELCAAFALGKSHHPMRAAFAARSLPSLLTDLRATRSFPAKAPPAPKIAFVFSGQGAQWWAMGRSLYEREEVVRDMWQRCDAISRTHGGPGIIDALLAPENESRLDHTDIAQPCLFTLQASLVELWRARGVNAELAIGHSVGEAAAAWTAGAFTLEEILALVIRRSRQQELTRGKGRMLAASMSREDAAAWERKSRGRIAVAAFNAPGQVTLSGDEEALNELAAQLAEERAFCRFLPMPYAFHSAAMEPIGEALRRELASVRGSFGTIEMISTVTGEAVSGPRLDGAYWWSNVREPVRFAAAIECALRGGCNTFLEIGPHPVLASAIAEIALRSDSEATIVPSLRRGDDDRETLLSALRTLYERGAAVRWEAIYRRAPRRVRLPAYPWQRQHLWHDAGVVAPETCATPPHPLLGDRQNHPQPTWVQDLDARLVPWLSDHRVGGTVVLPAAAYLEMAAAAVREYVGETTIFLEDIRFHRLLLLPDEHAVRTCVRLDPSSSTFQVLSASSADPSGWELHAEGIYRRGRVHDAPPVDLESTRRELDVARTADDVYRELSAMGQTYGTAFRGLESLLLQGSSRALGAVRDPITRESCQYLLFPPSLDSCFHPAVALKDEQGKPDRAVVVASLRQLKIFRPMPEKVWSHVTIVERRNGSHFGDFTIFDTTGAVVAQAQGLCVREIEPERKAASDDRTYVLEWEAADAPEAPPLNGDAAEVLILCDGEGFGERIAAHLRTRRIPVTTVCNEDARRDIGARSIQVDRREPGWAERLFETLAARGPLSSRIIDLWNWTTAEAAPAPGAHGCDVLLDLVHARLAHSAANDPARWLIVTRNAQSAAEGEPTLPVRAALWGFVRTLRTEHPAWGLALVDCADAALVEPLVRELYATDIEPEVALHREERKVRRLRRLREQVPQESQRVGRRPPAYALRIGQPGRIDALAFTGEPRRLPSAGEVEVEIAAAALNFRDVMKVLGIYPSPDGEEPRLGDEFSGTIVRCGPGVKKLEIGDRVAGFASAGGAFASHIVGPAESVWKIPAELSFERAASVPVAFGTAYHALHTLARLRRGETILVHAAAGGVGLAAVQLARNLGARVLATAGSEIKRAYLQSLGVELVMDSRSLDFADQTMEHTGGRGVDVVLNSLAGAFQQKSIAVCAPQGRFIEIGKRDLYQNGALPLAAFQRSLSFFAFDLAAVLASAGPARTALRRFLSQGCSRANLEPLPVTPFAATDIATAFRQMQSAEHIGKLIVHLGAETEPPPVPAEFWPDPAGSYLITGGTSGFGLAAARWLAERGAMHLVLVSRRGLAGPEESRQIEDLRERAVSVRIVAADVAEPAAVAALLSSIAASEAPLRGVFHGAMVLRDHALKDMSQEDLEAVLRPKLAGAWNLHEQTRALPIDSFVLFSSVAAIIGSPGQANYAAANAFLDALAHHRRDAGLPALSVNWGPIADVGIAASRPELARYMKNAGIIALPSEDALAPLAELMAGTEPQVCIADVEWQQLARAGRAPGAESMFRELIGAESPGIPAGVTQGWRDSMLALPVESQVAAASELIASQLATTLGMPVEDIDRSSPLAGMDSLMAVELVFRIQNHAGCDLPIDVFNGNLTLTQLAERLVAQINRTAPASGLANAVERGGETSEVAAPLLRKVPEPLFDLVQGGTLDRLTAAALMSWPDELFEHAGVVPQDFFRRLNGGKVSLDLIVETPLGSVGIFMLPMTTSRITPGETELFPRLLEGIRQATACGAECVALTGLIPSATSYGTSVRSACEAEPGLASVTTGHGTTIAAVMLNLATLLEEAGRDLEDETVLFYGVGSIGLGALKLMLEVFPHPAELRLCDPFRSTQFFDGLTDTLRREHGFTGRIGIVRSEDSRPGDEFFDSSVIIGATNVPNVLDVGRLAAGTLIVDDSAPHCLNGPAALKRFVQTQDILCTEGGFVRASGPMPRIAHVPPAVAGDLPAELPQLLFAMLGPQDITACVLSALLSARRSDLPPTVGLVDAQTARRHWEVLRELGFAAAGLNYEGTPLPEPFVERFRERFGKNDDAVAARS